MRIGFPIPYDPRSPPSSPIPILYPRPRSVVSFSPPRPYIYTYRSPSSRGILHINRPCCCCHCCHCCDHSSCSREAKNGREPDRERERVSPPLLNHSGPSWTWPTTLDTGLLTTYSTHDSTELDPSRLNISSLPNDRRPQFRCPLPPPSSASSSSSSSSSRNKLRAFPPNPSTFPFTTPFQIPVFIPGAGRAALPSPIMSSIVSVRFCPFLVSAPLRREE